MSDFALDDLDRARLDWPEPVLIDVIAEAYRLVAEVHEVASVARLHTRFLRELVEGGTREAAFLRLELIACCAARGIDPGAIEAADKAAFHELVGVVDGRFRNSPRLREHFAKRLDEAFAQLPVRSAPRGRQQSAPVRVLATARSHAGRPALRLGQRFAVSG